MERGTYRGRDKYNENKTWIIKITSCGHYYIGQEVYGRKQGKLARVRQSYLEDLVKSSVLDIIKIDS